MLESRQQQSGLTASDPLKKVFVWNPAIQRQRAWTCDDVRSNLHAFVAAFEAGC